MGRLETDKTKKVLFIDGYRNYNSSLSDLNLSGVQGDSALEITSGTCTCHLVSARTSLNWKDSIL